MLYLMVTGTSVCRVLEEFAEYNLPESVFFEDGDGFYVTMHRSNIGERSERDRSNIGEASEKHRRSIGEDDNVFYEKNLSATQLSIISIINKDNRVSASYIAEQIGISQRNFRSKAFLG